MTSLFSNKKDQKQEYSAPKVENTVPLNGAFNAFKRGLYMLRF